MRGQTKTTKEMRTGSWTTKEMRKHRTKKIRTGRINKEMRTETRKTKEMRTKQEQKEVQNTTKQSRHNPQ